VGAIKNGNVHSEGFELPLEFACIRGIIYHIPKLKDEAKFLSKEKSIPLHRALDVIAADIGVPEGWHAVVLKKWSYHSDGHIYHFDPLDSLNKISFDALQDPSLIGDFKHLEIVIDDLACQPVPSRNIRISLTDTPNCTIDGQLKKRLDDFLSERTLKAGCILAIKCAVHAIEARPDLRIYEDEIEVDRPTGTEDGP